MGIEANREVCRQYVENAIGLVTALVPVIGYEKSAAIAKEALKIGGSMYHLVLEKECLTHFRSGMSAVVAIFGIAWLADTFVDNNLPTIQPVIETFEGSGPVRNLCGEGCGSQHVLPGTAGQFE